MEWFTLFLGPVCFSVGYFFCMFTSKHDKALDTNDAKNRAALMERARQGKGYRDSAKEGPPVLEEATEVVKPKWSFRKFQHQDPVNSYMKTDLFIAENAKGQKYVTEYGNFWHDVTTGAEVKGDLDRELTEAFKMAKILYKVKHSKELVGAPI